MQGGSHCSPHSLCLGTGSRLELVSAHVTMNKNNGSCERPRQQAESQSQLLGDATTTQGKHVTALHTSKPDALEENTAEM